MLEIIDPGGLLVAQTSSVADGLRWASDRSMSARESAHRTPGTQADNIRPRGGGSVTKPVFKRYCDQLQRHIGWLATWQPDSPIAVGDVCLMEGRQMVRQFHLHATAGSDARDRLAYRRPVGWQSSKGITRKAQLARRDRSGRAHVG